MQRTYQFSQIGPTRAHQDIMDLLISVGRRQCYAKGTTIVQQGDPATGFWLIKQGQVTVCRFGSSGTLTVFAVLGAGDLLGDLACLSGAPRQVDAFAEQDAELIWIDNPQFELLLATQPQFARWLLASLASQLSTALNRIDTQLNLPAETRIARFLLDLAQRDGPHIAITQQELADFLRVSRITVGQIIKRMMGIGALKTGYRAITVVDAHALQNIARASRGGETVLADLHDLRLRK